LPRFHPLQKRWIVQDKRKETSPPAPLLEERGARRGT